MSKYTVKEKIKACEDYLSGKSSATEICIALGLSKKKPSGTFWQWIKQYNVHGKNAFLKSNGNNHYSKEFKQKIVNAYLDGEGSMLDIAIKYGIPGDSIVRQWVIYYNSHKELKDYDPKPEVYMAEAKRKTTLEERMEIVDYCITHDNDYKGTAEKYDVSYSQVHSWVKKYNKDGEEGLTDKRGRHKDHEEVDELERLRRENKRLKRQLEEEKMSVELLKKLKEFERRRYLPERN